MKNKNDIIKNKGLILIIIFSFSLIFSLVYVNLFANNIYIKDFEKTEEIEVFKEYKNKKIIACYGTKLRCKKIPYKIKGSVNTKRIGTYNVTYKIDYKDKHVSKIKKVTVVDTKKPELVIEGSFLNVCPNGKTSDVKISATDNYDGDITKNVKYKIEKNKIKYRVSDSSGNMARKEFDVNIMDNEKPSLILNDESIIYLSVGAKYVEPGYVAIDNCDGNITDQVLVSGTVDTKKPGTYVLTYSVKDEEGNLSKVKRTIKVFPKNNYKPGVNTAKTIYLTFDDGPGAHTARLLDILKNYNVKATFFVTGYNNNYNDLLKREKEEGHTIGLHSYSHNYGLIYTSIDAYMEDLLSIQNKVKEYTGEESKIIRFPGGSSNTISRKYRTHIMSDLTNKVESLGFRYFDWTIVSGDAGDTKDSNKIVSNVTGGITEDGLNVVLMHDIKPYTVDAIERIITFGLSNGYTFAPLTMDSPVVHQKVNN